MDESPIVLSVVIEAAPGREADLAVLLSGLLSPTRSEPGCISYELSRSAEKPGAFLFYEKFASQAALDAHIASAHFQAFLKKREEDDPIAAQTVTRWVPIV